MSDKAVSEDLYDRNRNMVFVYGLFGIGGLCLGIYGLVTGEMSMSERPSAMTYSRTIGVLHGTLAYLTTFIFLLVAFLSWNAVRSFRNGNNRLLFRLGVSTITLFVANVVFIRVMIAIYG